jgi:hypothetical protein
MIKQFGPSINLRDSHPLGSEHLMCGKGEFRAKLGLAALAVVLGSLAGCGRGMSPDPAPDMKIVASLRAAGGRGEAVAGTPGPAVGSGWATLKGTFKYGAAAPGEAFLSTANKDGAVCGSQVPNQTLVVDPGSKGIANIVIYARKVSRVFDAYKKAAPKKDEFDQKNCLFLTHVFAIQTKDTLIIKNSDSISHNTSLTPPGNPGINPLLPAGGEATYKFARQLSAPVEATCSIHPWMKAYIMSRDDPYFAVTDKDGGFKIENIPAGEEIEYQVWHERSPIGLAAKPAWQRGRFKLTLKADSTEDLQTIEVPPGAFQ